MKRHLSLAAGLPWLLTIGGIVGILCSAIITIDKFKLLQDPQFVPSCNLNPIIACGSIMASWQAEAFGFPNPLIGLVGFGAVTAIGLGLLAGARFKRWYWLGLQLGTIFGVGFVHWLFFQSVYSIQALCPWCMVVWVVTITTFWYVTLYNLQLGHLRLPRRLIGIGDFARRHHLDILILWFVIITALILKHFWYYFGNHLPF